MRRFFKKNEGEDHDFWLSYTDLMSGFLIVFIIASIIYYNNLSDIEKLLKGYSKTDITGMIEWYKNKGNMVNINDDFKDVFDGIDNVQFLEEEGSIRIYPTYNNTGDSILFETGKAEIQPNLESRLSEFGPRFVKKAMQLKNDGKNIAEIRIEGHTDTDGTFFGDTNDKGVYTKDEGNLLLSSRRAFMIYKYIYDNCCRSPEEKEFVLNHMISVGYSSQKTIKDEQGKEDKDKSRRIEFRIISK